MAQVRDETFLFTSTFSGWKENMVSNRFSPEEMVSITLERSSPHDFQWFSDVESGIPVDNGVYFIMYKEPNTSNPKLFDYSYLNKPIFIQWRLQKLNLTIDLTHFN